MMYVTYYSTWAMKMQQTTQMLLSRPGSKAREEFQKNGKIKAKKMTVQG